MSGLRKRLKPDSLIKKCVYCIVLSAAVMLAVIWILTRQAMFVLLKPEFRKNDSILTSSVSTKISYVLHQNSQYVLRFWRDSELMEKAARYAEQTAGKRADGADTEYTAGQTGNGTHTGHDAEGGGRDRKEILEKLDSEQMGGSQPGAIVQNRDVFLAADGKVCLAKKKAESYARQVMESDWFAGLPEAFGKLSVTARAEGGLERIYSPVFPAEQGREEFLAFAVPYNTDSHTIYIVMIEPFSDFRNLFSDFEEAGIRDFCLLGYGHEILFQNPEQSFMNTVPRADRSAFDENAQYTTKVTQRGKYTVFSSMASYSIDQIQVAAMLTQTDFLRPYLPFIRSVMILFSVCMALVAVLLILVLRRSLNRLKKLSVQMVSVQKEGGRHIENYRIPERIVSDDEVGAAADSFYRMLEEIQRNAARIEEQNRREKRIEYSLLLSQIDPHFIYNTLNTVTYLARLDRAKDIVVLNKALIGMLHDRLRMSQLQIWDTVEEERTQIDYYMTIQNYLCTNKTAYTFEVAEECRGIRYPKNVIQPFVENSILHGILLHKDAEGRPVPGIIRIRIWREDGSGDCRTVTEIEDNGAGMSREETKRYFGDDLDLSWDGMSEEKAVRKHIGIYNIRMRLRYLYGESFHLETGVSELGGLRIVLRFPEKTGETETNLFRQEKITKA